MNETAWEKIANTHCVKRDKINYFEAQVLLFSGSNIIIFFWLWMDEFVVVALRNFFFN